MNFITFFVVIGEIDVKAMLDPGSAKPRAKLTMSCLVFADLSMVMDDIFFGEDPSAFNSNNTSKRKKKKTKQQQQHQDTLGDDEKAIQGQGLASVNHMDAFTNVFIAKAIEAIIFDAQVPPERLQKRAEPEELVDILLTDKYQKIKGKQELTYAPRLTLSSCTYTLQNHLQRMKPWSIFILVNTSNVKATWRSLNAS